MELNRLELLRCANAEFRSFIAALGDGSGRSFSLEDLARVNVQLEQIGLMLDGRATELDRQCPRELAEYAENLLRLSELIKIHEELLARQQPKAGISLAQVNGIAAWSALARELAERRP